MSNSPRVYLPESQETWILPLQKAPQDRKGMLKHHFFGVGVAALHGLWDVGSYYPNPNPIRDRIRALSSEKCRVHWTARKFLLKDHFLAYNSLLILSLHTPHLAEAPKSRDFVCSLLTSIFQLPRDVVLDILNTRIYKQTPNPASQDLMGKKENVVPSNRQ